jgi:hypothetical protein
MFGKTLVIAAVAGACVSGALAKPTTPGAVKNKVRATAPTGGSGGHTDAIIFSDNFDALTPGNIIGQNGWQGWSGTIPAPEGYVVNTFSSSPSQSLRITTATTTGSTSDVVQVFNQTGGKYKFKAKTYVPSTTSGNGYFILLNTYPVFDWSVQIFFNSTANTVTLAAAHTGQIGNTLTLVEDAWVEHVVDIDLDAAIPVFSVKYNNQDLCVGQTWDDLNKNTLQCVDLYSETVVDMFFDDVVLESVTSCYPDCDGVNGLTVQDFGCFQTKFVQQDPYADCDGINGLTVQDFGCFQTKFVQGCNP